MFRGLTNGKLNKTRFNIFSIEIPLHQILGCKKGKALKQLKNATPSTVGGDKLQYMYKLITNKIVAKATSREMFRGLSSTLDGNIEENKRNLDSKVASIEMGGSEKIPVVNAVPAETTNKNTFNSNYTTQTNEQKYAQLHELCIPVNSTTKTFLSKQDTPHQTMVPKIDFFKIPKGKNTIMIAKALNKIKLSK